MAGGLFKSFGITFLVVGIVLVLAGVAAAIVGFVQESENQDNQGFFQQPSRDESELNLGLVAVGGMAGVAGLALLIVGGVFVGVGSARQNRALVQAINERKEVQANAD